VTSPMAGDLTRRVPPHRWCPAPQGVTAAPHHAVSNVPSLAGGIPPSRAAVAVENRQRVRSADQMPRNLQEIRADQAGSMTVRNLVAVLDAKLRLGARYGVYEYEANQEGFHECSAIFQRLAADERRQVQELLDLLDSPPLRRFRRQSPPNRVIGNWE
jgi:hypothetical protein